MGEPNKQVQFSVSMPARLRYIIESRSQENHRSISQEIAFLCDYALAVESRVNTPLMQRLLYLMDQAERENNPETETN